MKHIVVHYQRTIGVGYQANIAGETRGLLISEAILKHIVVHYQRTIGVGYQANIEKHLGF